VRHRHWLILIFACAPFAQSQPPPPAPGKASHSNQKNASSKSAEHNPDERSPEENSSRLNKSSSPVTSGNNKNAAAPQSEKPPAEWWFIASTILSAAATVAIALLGFFQWRAMRRQADYMRRGLRIAIRQARIADRNASAAIKSAESAKESLEVTRKALVLSQRPRIEVRNVQIPSDIVGRIFNAQRVSEIPDIIEGSFEIINVGSTTASVIAVECRVVLWERLPMAFARSQLDAVRIIPQQLRPGVYGTRTFSESIDPLAIHFAHILLHVVGWIGYEDELGNYRSTNFCRVLDRKSQRLKKVDDRDYENAD
jgi:hypothetical protein